MALSYQTELPAFFTPQKVNLKIGPNPRRLLTENGQIPEDGIPGLAKSRKISEILAYDRPESHKRI
jgi:hypothetical protein